jgi:hypothetical protein
MKKKVYEETGAMDVNCEKWHESEPSIVSYEIHRNKLACNPCHVSHVVSCTNCHFDTFVQSGEKEKILRAGYS